MGSTIRAALAAPTMALTLVAAVACADDGVSGLPTEPPSPDPTTTVSVTTTTTTAAAAAPTTTTVRPTPAVAVGAVPGNVAAVSAIRAWAIDLVAAPSKLAEKCWTVPPGAVATRYADSERILTALAKPGVDGQYAVSWSAGGTTVAAKRSEIASGYACPHVYPTGAVSFYSEEDARYAVERYLGRFTGKPVDPADIEGDYPLVCPGNSPWDPRGSGQGGQPPLKVNPGMLTGAKKFDTESITVSQVRGNYTDVTAAVTNASGVTQTKRFTLAIGPDGYCLGDVA